MEVSLIYNLKGFANLITTELLPLTDDDTDSSKVQIHNLGRYQPPSGMYS